VAVKVSVVVPVYNPGNHVDDCIASVLRQTLPAAEMEAIFVDDGSTDGTGERLDRLAAEHPDAVRVTHIENSGWPGRPRNVGVDAARGEFVYFVDNDDWIEDEALERLYATATRTGADIVIGKVVGHGKPVPNELFRVNRDDARLDTDPLLTLLTPHKLFRRAFLAEHGLRFPEGRRRLEDHAFVVHAYFHARRIAVLSDYPCYHWVRREDASNASFERADSGYFDNLREVLDIVEAHTEPGPLRDRLLSHWYRSKILHRVGAPKLLRYDPDYRLSLMVEGRRLAAERYSAAVVDRLPANLRVRARLLEGGHFDGLQALAEWEKDLRLVLDPGPVRWQDGVLRLPLRARLLDAAGEPPVVRREQGRLCWQLPDGVPGAADVGPEVRDVDGELGEPTLRVFLEGRRSEVRYLLPVEHHVEVREAGGRATVDLTADVRLDPWAAAAGAPLTRGVWDLHATLALAGLSAVARVWVAADGVPPPGVADAPARVVRPYRTTHGNLSLDVGQARTTLLEAFRPAAADARAERHGRTLDVALGLPVAVANGSAVPAKLVLVAIGDSGRRLTVPARVVARGTGGRLEGSAPYSRRPHGDRLSPGTWTLSAGVGDVRPTALDLALSVARNGTSTVGRPGEVAARAPARGLRRSAARVPLVRATVRAVRRARRRLRAPV
jgi:poly(ribitol-phosphate) beta-N-acetylglucosaminyltransferase